MIFMREYRIGKGVFLYNEAHVLNTLLDTLLLELRINRLKSIIDQWVRAVYL